MNWFLIALINPLAHAVANHFDKYLITRWMKDSPVGVLVIFSSLFAVVVLPVLILIDPNLLAAIDIGRSSILILNGALLAGAILLYLYALELDEASYVVPFFQLIPVFGFLLGYFILGEVLSSNQLWAGALIFIGSTILSIEFIEGRAKVKFRLVYLMLGASFLYAVNGVVFKYFTPHEGFKVSLFWNMVGMVLFGILLLIVDKKYRRQFLHLLRTHHYNIIGLNIINEIIGLIGEIALMYAILLAPVALVLSVGGLQPLFVFIIGVGITLFFPRFGKESILFHHLIQKIVAILIILAGFYFLTT